MQKLVVFSVGVASILASIAQAGITPLAGGSAGSSLNQADLETARSLRSTSKTDTRAVYVFAGDRVIPQLVDGAGWQTSMTFVNLENRPVVFNLYFFADNGLDLHIPIQGAGVLRGATIALGVAESFTVDTVGDSAQLSQGWAYIQTQNVGDSVGGLTVFRQSVPGRPDFEAVVPTVNQFDGHFVLMFDNTKWITAMAIANPTNNPVIVPMNVRDETGAIAERQTISLAPYEHKTFVIPDAFKVTAGRRGKMEFVASGFGVAALGLRFNGSGAFTSFHVLANVAWMSQ